MRNACGGDGNQEEQLEQEVSHMIAQYKEAVKYYYRRDCVVGGGSFGRHATGKLGGRCLSSSRSVSSATWLELKPRQTVFLPAERLRISIRIQCPQIIGE
eukprot:4653766-Amphidinium_carterae.1